jgi:hypothetical protein
VRLRFSGGRRERTRLIGLHAPEANENEKLARDVTRTGRDRQTILALGRQATAFARRLLPVRTVVEVEQDLWPRDRRGRLLAYVWTAEGVMMNLVILREGYAQVLTFRPNTKYQTTRFSPASAKHGKLGAACGLSREPCPRFRRPARAGSSPCDAASASASEAAMAASGCPRSSAAELERSLGSGQPC